MNRYKRFGFFSLFVFSSALCTKSNDMKSMNKVQLISYLGKDPEFRQCSNGNEMVYIRLATDYWFHPKKGEAKKYTEWHNVCLWSREQIRKMKNYLIKGSHVMVEGRLVYRLITDKNGNEQKITEIKAFTLIDIDR